jgi:hypothetical protein
MDYDMKKPCENCPFRRGTSMRLRRLRVREIVSNMLHSSGGDFPCHKTFDHDENDECVEKPGTKHCAGALIYAEKHKRATQAMRFAERFGAYDAAALMADKEAVDSVFDSLKEMTDWLAQED